MEKKLILFESTLYTAIKTYVVANRYRVYVFLLFGLGLMALPIIPFINLYITKTIVHSLVIIALFVLFRVPAKALYAFLMMLICISACIYIFSVDSLYEYVSSLSFLVFILMVIQLLIDTKE